MASGAAQTTRHSRGTLFRQWWCRNRPSCSIPSAEWLPAFRSVAWIREELQVLGLLAHERSPAQRRSWPHTRHCLKDFGFSCERLALVVLESDVESSELAQAWYQKTPHTAVMLRT